MPWTDIHSGLLVFVMDISNQETQVKNLLEIRAFCGDDVGQAYTGDALGNGHNKQEKEATAHRR